ncbi:MAG TPA: NAD(P)H-dependent oxidoreductase [Methylomirabilota bacterium]|nr:NAD(P)H-dependent oxidoreductase [Methylomirabilota bacterium]
MPRTNPRLLVFGGSLRTGSYSAALAALAVQVLALRDVDVTRISLADYPLPLYDADLEAEQGVPEAAKRLHQMMISHGGIFIATPEYNASTPPLLKNALDWTSRVRTGGAGAPSPWKERIYALGSTSPGPFGGMRALMHLRQILELGLGAMVLPEQIAVTFAASAFGVDGSLKDDRSAARLETVLGRLVEEAGRYTPD